MTPPGSLMSVRTFALVGGQEAEGAGRAEVAFGLGVGLALGVGVVAAAEVVVLGEDDSRASL